ncbi:MAG TPA: diguanylate cyclase, partial [Actinomycetota bacterium]|nr:diguanylate cyclase [Actinomycetota bacterium]
MRSELGDVVEARFEERRDDLDISAAGSILLVEDDVDYAAAVEGMLAPLKGSGYSLVRVRTLEEARHVLTARDVACVIADLALPDARGVDVVDSLHDLSPEVAIIVLTAMEEEETAMEALQMGAQDYITKTSADARLLEKAVKYSIERKRLQSELAHQAVHDPLTGLPNRTLFLDRLEMALARLDRYRRAIAVIFFDIDNFKLINDSLGHDIGDQMLTLVGERLASLMRGGDTVARLGGDEFCLLCESVPDDDRARAIGMRIETAFKQPLIVAGREFYVTGSVGVACTNDPATDPKSILADADA